MRITFIVLLLSNVFTVQLPPASASPAATRVVSAAVEKEAGQGELAAAAAVAEPLAAAARASTPPVVVVSSRPHAALPDAREPIAMLLIGSMLIGLAAAVRRAV
jgi:hypothetical protein